MNKRTPDTSALETEILANTVCNHDPYDYVIVPSFVKASALPEIHESYPKIDKPGSFPDQTLDFGLAFASLLQELQGSEMRAAIEKVFDIDLTDCPNTLTVRGQCQRKDGRIHPDSKEKIITVLVYMNPSWEEGGGQLRVLRSADDLENCAAEIPPVEGTLFAFRRCDYSWHGHKPFVGQRRVLQLNWVTNNRFAKREQERHALSAFFKRYSK